MLYEKETRINPTVETGEGPKALIAFKNYALRYGVRTMADLGPSTLMIPCVIGKLHIADYGVLRTVLLLCRVERSRIN